ncbi:MAG: hypothetical protein HC860_11265 [Alkalinema sp. RU_4_3]|nr:hypothetical protein [Alkalinema sp. RU_4_3]
MLNMRKTPSAIAKLTLGSMMLALGAAPASAWWFKAEPTPAARYQSCARDLDKAGIKGNTVASACSEVVRPEELGTCVEKIVMQKADPTVTLKACTQVRRPVELGICVTDVRRQDKDAPLNETIEYCRRSLLPAQYGGCVVGFNRKPLQLATKDGLNTCIDASDRPTDLRPNFVPIDRLPSLSNNLSTGPTIQNNPVTPVPTADPKQPAAQLY